MEQRYQAVLAVIRDGVPIVEVAHRFDVSRQAVHRWLRWYEDQGLPGLVDRSHRPARCSHQMPADVEVWVLEARRRNPGWGPRRLVHEAARAGVDPVPSRSGVYRALKRAGMIEPGGRHRRDRRFRRWERGGAMELWQMDVVGGMVLADGRDCKILTGIDDHSSHRRRPDLQSLGVAERLCSQCEALEFDSAAPCGSNWTSSCPLPTSSPRLARQAAATMALSWASTRARRWPGGRGSSRSMSTGWSNSES
jgi:transposase